MTEFHERGRPRHEGRSGEPTARLHMRPVGRDQTKQREGRTGWFGFSLKAQLITTFSGSNQRGQPAAGEQRAEVGGKEEAAVFKVRTGS